jgi:hypothetical protein
MYPSVLLSVCFISELLGVFKLNLVLRCLQMKLLAVDFNDSWYCPNWQGAETDLSQMADSQGHFVGHEMYVCLRSDTFTAIILRHAIK